MTKTELKQNWEEVLKELSSTLGTQKTEIFFRPLVPCKLDEKEEKLLLLCASRSPIFKGRAEQYKNELESAVINAFGKAYKIEILEKAPEEKGSMGFEEENRPDPDYSFETFVTGPNNQFAYAASKAVTDGYSKKYNPLFLYGDSGLGKTHLMHAVWQYVLLHHPQKKVLFVSSETFTNELIAAIGNRKQKEFRDKYRSIDYLLFDDVQFIKRSNSSEEELFNTFDALYRARKQIIFTSDRPPKDLGDLPERLISRFSWGLIVDIQPPDYETRVAILQKKAMMKNLELDPPLMEAIEIIAQNVRSNIRVLEEAFNRVIYYAGFTREKFSASLVRKVLPDIFDSSKPAITPETIKRKVANYFGIKISELESKKRTRSVVFPRQLAIYLIRENTDCSFPQIGQFFGGRDHTTVLYTCEKVASDIKTNPEVKATVDALTKLLTD